MVSFRNCSSRCDVQLVLFVIFRLVENYSYGDHVQVGDLSGRERLSYTS